MFVRRNYNQVIGQIRCHSDKMKLSSLPFQILLFFNRWFSVAYVILEISILIWKKFQVMTRWMVGCD